MTSNYIYHYMLGDKERSLISIFLRNGKSFEYIYKEFNISPAYIRNNIWPDILKTKPIKLGHKNCAYYDDEMLYGKLNLNYNIDDFSISELLAYNND